MATRCGNLVWCGFELGSFGDPRNALTTRDAWLKTVLGKFFIVIRPRRKRYPKSKKILRIFLKSHSTTAPRESNLRPLAVVCEKGYRPFSSFFFLYRAVLFIYLKNDTWLQIPPEESKDKRNKKKMIYQELLRLTIQYINIPFREITHAAPNKANTIEITKISEKVWLFCK